MGLLRVTGLAGSPRTGPEGLLAELAHARLGHLVDEEDVLGQLPLRQPLGEELKDLFAGELFAGLDDDPGQRALHPSGVWDGDHCGLSHFGVRHDRVLEVDGDDPWNMGTIGRMLSCSVMALLEPETPASECSQMERWEYSSPFGSPMVPGV
jgi:hypothetical protein